MTVIPYTCTVYLKTKQTLTFTPSKHTHVPILQTHRMQSMHDVICLVMGNVWFILLEGKSCTQKGAHRDVSREEEWDTERTQPQRRKCLGMSGICIVFLGVRELLFSSIPWHSGTGWRGSWTANGVPVRSFRMSCKARIHFFPIEQCNSGI